MDDWRWWTAHPETSGVVKVLRRAIAVSSEDDPARQDLAISEMQFQAGLSADSTDLPELMAACAAALNIVGVDAWGGRSLLALADVLEQASAATESQVKLLCEEWWGFVDNAEAEVSQVIDAVSHPLDERAEIAAVEAIADALAYACPLLLMSPLRPTDMVVVPINAYPLAERYRDALSSCIHATVVGVHAVQYLDRLGDSLHNESDIISTLCESLTDPWRAVMSHPPTPEPVANRQVGIVVQGPWEHGAA